MARIEEDVDIDSLATETFSKNTPNALQTSLGDALDQILTCAEASIRINSFGGMGNGVDNKIKGCYLTNTAYNQSIKGFPKYQPLLSVGNVLMVQIYRANTLILHRLDSQLTAIKNNANALNEINRVIGSVSYYGHHRHYDEDEFQ